MKLVTAICLGIISILLIFPAAGGLAETVEEEAAPSTDYFSDNEHCLAYRASKIMFFVIPMEVIGKNCNISSHVKIIENGTQLRVVASVPLEKFDSGSSHRDRHISEYLKADQFPDIKFSTNWVDITSFREFISAGPQEIQGSLFIAGVEKNVSFPLQLVRRENYLILETTLPATITDYGVSIPGAGIANFLIDPSQDFEIMVHFRMDLVPGAENVLGAELAALPPQ